MAAGSRAPTTRGSTTRPGKLVGVPGKEAFDELDVDGLIEYPTVERVGAVFAVLTVGAEFDLDEWLGDMLGALEMLQLDKLHRHDVETKLPSGNWKATADGYLDGYHLGYLHRNSIGAKSITNRNTFDLYGPHVRIGFANKPITEYRDIPPEEWTDNYACFSLVHYVFPNISISGHPDRSLMISRIFPGPARGRVARSSSTSTSASRWSTTRRSPTPRPSASSTPTSPTTRTSSP